eukprot:6201133-Pleurochrysis_carterae.AAC.3
MSNQNFNFTTAAPPTPMKTSALGAVNAAATSKTQSHRPGVTVRSSLSCILYCAQGQKCDCKYAGCFMGGTVQLRVVFTARVCRYHRSGSRPRARLAAPPAQGPLRIRRNSLGTHAPLSKCAASSCKRRAAVETWQVPHVTRKHCSRGSLPCLSEGVQSSCAGRRRGSSQAAPLGTALASSPSRLGSCGRQKAAVWEPSPTAAAVPAAPVPVASGAQAACCRAVASEQGTAPSWAVLVPSAAFANTPVASRALDSRPAGSTASPAAEVIAGVPVLGLAAAHVAARYFRRDSRSVTEVARGRATGLQCYAVAVPVEVALLRPSSCRGFLKLPLPPRPVLLACSASREAESGAGAVPHRGVKGGCAAVGLSTFTCGAGWSGGRRGVCGATAAGEGTSTDGEGSAHAERGCTHCRLADG